MAFTRTYPSQVIPSNPSDADFETNFRSNTTDLLSATQDIDDEVSTGRGGYTSLTARMTALEGTAGVAASFWSIDSNASGSSGNTFFTITGADSTTLYVAGRAIRIISSSGTVYGYVSSSSFSTNTTVNIVSDSIGTSLTISGTVTSIAYATQDLNSRDLISTSNISSTGMNTLTGTSIAMAIALG